MSVAFKNAMMGGVILLLIESVSNIVTAVSMRRQYQMMEEMQKAEMEKMKKAMARGGKPVNPWEVDFNPEMAKSSTKEAETLLDKAKAFSF
jgi:hypothetical protein